MAETEDATEAPGESELASGRKPRGRRRRPATGLQRGRRANRISAAEGGARRSGIGAEQSRERERERERRRVAATPIYILFHFPYPLYIFKAPAGAQRQSKNLPLPTNLRDLEVNPVISPLAPHILCFFYFFPLFFSSLPRRELRVLALRGERGLFGVTSFVGTFCFSLVCCRGRKKRKWRGTRR